MTLRRLVYVVVLMLVACSTGRKPPVAHKPPAPHKPPATRAEFRGVFIATVANIDWPSAPGLPVAQQKAELIRLLDLAARLKFTAVIFQVRPAGDALYASPFEPWSEFLTGQMGRAPGYDPLAFAITEAHRRGLELHAWVNPFRASHPKATGPVATNHVTRSHPDWVRSSGKYRWLDPGEPAAVDYVLNVIRDLVQRYAVDGIHLDDYFYPYPETNADFPDDATYRRAATKLDRADWRRENINNFVRRLYTTVKQTKPAVRVGISPFGIWRSGVPANVRGSGSYDTLYADSRLWLWNGWVDYLAPQLYWRIASPQQSFPELLTWWAAQNPRRRQLVPALYTSRIDDGTSQEWPATEIVNQIALTRTTPGVGGYIHFSMRALAENRDGITSRIAPAALAR